LPFADLSQKKLLQEFCFYREKTTWNIKIKNGKAILRVNTGDSQCGAINGLAVTKSCGLKLERVATEFNLEAVKGTTDNFTIKVSNPTDKCSSTIYLGAPQSWDSSDVVLFTKKEANFKTFKAFQQWKLIPDTPLDPCTTLQGASCKTSSTSVCAKDDAKKRACTKAAPGYYLVNDLTRACTPQLNCVTSGSTCLAASGLTDKLTCTAPKAGNFIGSGVVKPCISQLNCVTSGSTCLAASGLTDKLICTAPKAGNFIGSGVVKPCISQLNCVTSGTTCSAVATYTTKLTCTAASQGYYLEAGIPKQCTKQTNCITAGDTCLTASGLTESLTCTAADPGYYLDSGVPSECTATCGSDSVLDTSPCTGTTTTNGAVCAGLVLVFNTNLGTADKTVGIALGGTMNVVVDWGDGKTDTYTSSGVKTHVYDADGIYKVNITGSMSAYGAVNVTGITKLIRVDAFGNLGITSWEYGFFGASNLLSVPSTLPAGATKLDSMFLLNTVFNSDISEWDVSTVTSMKSMFFAAQAFDQNLNSWEVGSVTNMESMFSVAAIFNSDISS
jgi:hypothetical protein